LRTARPNPRRNRSAKQPDKKSAFSLLATQTPEPASGRGWSDAYLALTQAEPGRQSLLGKSNRLVNWISAQSAPPMLPPYHAGAAKSELITLLEAGHEGVKLSQEEMDKIACWIDLLVPYCGDYTENNIWSEKEVAKYDHFLTKRRHMERLETANIAQLIDERTP